MILWRIHNPDFQRLTSKSLSAPTVTSSHSRSKYWGTDPSVLQCCWETMKEYTQIPILKDWHQSLQYAECSKRLSTLRRLRNRSLYIAMMPWEPWKMFEIPTSKDCLQNHQVRRLQQAPVQSPPFLLKCSRWEKPRASKKMFTKSPWSHAVTPVVWRRVENSKVWIPTNSTEWDANIPTFKDWHQSPWVRWS